MGEIDTTVPFASVRDAVYMFDESCSLNTQCVFPSTNNLQLKKIDCLQGELHKLRGEFTNTQTQLLIEQNKTKESFQELFKIKTYFEEKNLENKNAIVSKLCTFDDKLEMGCEKTSQNEHKVERDHTPQHPNGVEDLKDHPKSNLCDFQNDKETNNKVQKHIVFEDNIQVSEVETNCDEKLCIFSEQNPTNVDEILFEINGTPNNKCVEIKEHSKALEEGFGVRKLMDKVEDANVQIEGLKAELQEARHKQLSINAHLERLEDELKAAKEVEKCALLKEMEAKHAMERLRLDYENFRNENEKAKTIVDIFQDMDAMPTLALQREEELLASLSLLQSELEDKSIELVHYKEKAEKLSLFQRDEDSNHLLNHFNVANSKDANTNESLFELHEATQEVGDEDFEAKNETTKTFHEMGLGKKDLEKTLFFDQKLEEEEGFSSTLDESKVNCAKVRELGSSTNSDDERSKTLSTSNPSFMNEALEDVGEMVENNNNLKRWNSKVAKKHSLNGKEKKRCPIDLSIHESFLQLNKHNALLLKEPLEHDALFPCSFSPHEMSKKKLHLCKLLSFLGRKMKS